MKFLSMLLGCQLGISLFCSTELLEVFTEKVQPVKVFTEVSSYAEDCSHRLTLKH